VHFTPLLLILVPGAASVACQMQNGDQGDLPCKASFQKGPKEVMPFVLKDQSWNNLSMVEGYAISVVISYACRERK
jgi:hypothetical protein